MGLPSSANTGKTEPEAQAEPASSSQAAELPTSGHADMPQSYIPREARERPTKKMVNRSAPNRPGIARFLWDSRVLLHSGTFVNDVHAPVLECCICGDYAFNNAWDIIIACQCGSVKHHRCQELWGVWHKRWSASCQPSIRRCGKKPKI